MTSSPDPSSAKQDPWPCPVARSSMRQSDEGCSPDLFKTDQKKGVGYLLLIIQRSFSHCSDQSSTQKHNNIPVRCSQMLADACGEQSSSSSDFAALSCPSQLSPKQSTSVLRYPKHFQTPSQMLPIKPASPKQSYKSQPVPDCPNMSKQYRSSPQSTRMVCLHTQDVAASL